MILDISNSDQDGANYHIIYKWIYRYDYTINNDLYSTYEIWTVEDEDKIL